MKVHCEMQQDKACLQLVHSTLQWMPRPSHGPQQMGQSILSTPSLSCDVVKVLTEGIYLFCAELLALPKPVRTASPMLLTLQTAHPDIQGPEPSFASARPAFGSIPASHTSFSMTHVDLALKKILILLSILYALPASQNTARRGKMTSRPSIR